MTSSIHPLDEALALTSSSPGQYTGQTHPGYWNMVSPFGGVTAATLLQAVMQHPQRLGDPLSLTVNYAGALVAGPFTVQATPVRTNRSTQHWTLSILQADAEGCVAEILVLAAALSIPDPRERPADRDENKRNDQENDRGEAFDEGHHEHHGCSDHQGFRLSQKLA